MEIIFVIALWAFFAWICYSIAKKNGREPVLAGFMGLFFGIIAIIIYLIMGKTKLLKEQEQREAFKKFKDEENK